MDVPPALSHHLGFLLKHAQLDLRAISEPALAELGVTGREAAILTLLEDEGPRSQQRLADRLEVDRTTMVALVDALERKQLVTRHRDADDRRAYALELTAEGRRTVARSEGVIAAAEREFLAPLPEAQREQLARMLLMLIR